MANGDAKHAAEVAARASYGRLVAILASRSGDIARAEDALADAFAAALASWATDGVPESPAGWLLVAARRRLMNQARHVRVQEEAVHDVGLAIEERALRDDDWSGIDDRLKLLFVCAHPAIEPNVRTPLMLQTVLGLPADRIASAFLVAPRAMSQRLVRAKTKIKLARLRFEVPAAEELPDRLDDVLEAIYGAYGTGWEDAGSAGDRGLAEEALFLGRLVASLLPAEPETKGLLALMLFCESRRSARRDADGRFVPLAAQDPGRWSRPMIVEADGHLTEAARLARFGRYQCEAAIQSLHAQRAVTGEPQHAALRTLYDLLLARAPSVGVAVARAAVLLDAGDRAAARAALAALDPGDVAAYQPFWVTRAGVGEAFGDGPEARADLVRALGLTEDASVRVFLSARLSRMP